MVFVSKWLKLSTFFKWSLVLFATMFFTLSTVAPRLNQNSLHKWVLWKVVVLFSFDAKSNSHAHLIRVSFTIYYFNATFKSDATRFIRNEEMGTHRWIVICYARTGKMLKHWTGSRTLYLLSLIIDRTQDTLAATCIMYTRPMSIQNGRINHFTDQWMPHIAEIFIRLIFLRNRCVRFCLSSLRTEYSRQQEKKNLPQTSQMHFDYMHTIASVSKHSNGLNLW